jgi:hypothetical protein
VGGPGLLPRGKPRPPVPGRRAGVACGRADEYLRAPHPGGHQHDGVRAHARARCVPR